MSDQYWRDKAACAGMNPALWGAGRASTAADILKGKQICLTRCSVVNECLRDAFNNEAATPSSMATIRGGLTKEERARLRNRPNSRNNQPITMTAKEHQRRSYVAVRVRKDTDAAVELGVPLPEYRLWRQRYFDGGDGKGAPQDKHRVNTPAEEALRLKAHAQGMSDSQIADICDTTKWAIQRWRKRRGLEPNIKASVSA